MVTNDDILETYHSIDGTFTLIMLSRYCDKLLFSCYFCFSFDLHSGASGWSKRSRSDAATRREPPNFTERRTPLLIQRRTVLIDLPVRRAMSPARRYSARSVMQVSRDGVRVTYPYRPSAVAQPVRVLLGGREGAKVEQEPHCQLSYAQKLLLFLMRNLLSGGPSSAQNIKISVGQIRVYRLVYKPPQINDLEEVCSLRMQICSSLNGRA
jgi:hypothetical protein